MKIVDRTTFLALPAGALFAKYTPCSFGDLCIKGETYPATDGGVGDFLVLSIADAIACTGSADLMDKLQRAPESGESLPMDFDSSGRDGMFDADQLFAVWEWQDVFGLVATLQSTLPGAEVIAESRKYVDFRQVVMSDPVVNRIARAGGSAAECVVALANQKSALIARIMELESIAPKKLRANDGSVLVWHCPDELVPEAKS